MSIRAQCISCVGMLLLSWSGLSGAEGWDRVKAGMKPDEIVDAVGSPLLARKGRGFEVLTYDRGAEVVLYRGLVVAWTPPPGSGDDSGRQIDFRPVVMAAAAASAKAREAVPVRYIPRGEAQAEYQRTVPLRWRIQRF